MFLDNTAIITGASSGIGKAISLKLAQEGWRICITGRRITLLEKLKEEITHTYNTEVLIKSFDIRNQQETEKAINTLPEEWKKIDVLINNAGLAAGLDFIQEGNINDWEVMIDTNIKGLLYITRAVAPLMIKEKKGHIINIGSIAGKEVYAKGNVYCATKHAVDALTKGMRIDLLKHNIRVTSICPGNTTETEFSITRFKGNTTLANQVYEGYTALTAGDVAEAIYFAITRPPHVTINDMVIMSTAQANTTHLNRQPIK